MKEFISDYNNQNSSIEYDDELNPSDLECRNLTSNDVDQALNTLEIDQNLSQKYIISSENDTLSILPKQEYNDCCRLLRSNTSSRLLLPLARRGRPYISTRSHRLLCSNCTKIKHQQQIDILKIQNQFNSNHIFQTTINLDISSNEQIPLNNHQYHTNQMLIWKINTLNRNTIDLSYDTNSLTENEKKILLNETIKKLQIILNNQSTIITDNNQDNIDFTYHTLQTTINILSSSHNSI